jgi:hypothetical protein
MSGRLGSFSLPNLSLFIVKVLAGEYPLLCKISFYLMILRRLCRLSVGLISNQMNLDLFYSLYARRLTHRLSSWPRIGWLKKLQLTILMAG